MDPSMSPTTSNSLDLLEEKFRRVEEANERRVLGEPDQSSLRDPPESRQRRKKPAVSISQFGKQDTQGDDGIPSSASSPLSAAASKSTFYHTLAHPRSVDSFMSQHSEQETRYTEEELEIQVERIVGRQGLPKTVGALLPRRLTSVKPQQLDYVAINRNMVIDVSVETTTELSRFSADLNPSTAYATRSSRPRAATVEDLPSHGGLVERAKDFARKLRRKSRA